MAEQVTPRPFVRAPERTLWFLRHRRYLRYMARELSCVFIGAYTLLLVTGLARLAQGRAAYEAFLEALGSPASLVFHVIALAFACYHSVTWFALTPKALELSWRGQPLAPGAVAALHYGAWALISALLLWAAGAW